MSDGHPDRSHTSGIITKVYRNGTLVIDDALRVERAAIFDVRNVGSMPR